MKPPDLLEQQLTWPNTREKDSPATGSEIDSDIERIRHSARSHLDKIANAEGVRKFEPRIALIQRATLGLSHRSFATLKGC
jgi:hypothetical protein